MLQSSGRLTPDLFCIYVLVCSEMASMRKNQHALGLTAPKLRVLLQLMDLRVCAPHSDGRERCSCCNGPRPFLALHPAVSMPLACL